jgi:acetylornithine deacetylase/succinyl-diaminopimelate desuccinylase-like protein
MNLQRPDGSVSLNLGVKGIVYFELESRGGEWGGPAEGARVHGSTKSLVDAPALRLVQAIAALVSPGWQHHRRRRATTTPVRGPTLDEQRLINALAQSGQFDQAHARGQLGVARWIDGLEGRDAIMRNLFDPTLNINGLWSGYTGEGTKTILPHVATAKIDSRLPPGLEPEDAWTG